VSPPLAGNSPTSDGFVSSLNRYSGDERVPLPLPLVLPEDCFLLCSLCVVDLSPSTLMVSVTSMIADSCTTSALSRRREHLYCPLSQHTETTEAEKIC
jgi:hypothetical protein